MICFAVTFDVAPEHWDEARRLLDELTQHTRRESGNRMYLAHQSHSERRKFFLYEQYVDEAALEAHRQSPHFDQFATNGLYKLVSARTIEFFAPLF
jgi:quinol monooxygenase YgiN